MQHRVNEKSGKIKHGYKTKDLNAYTRQTIYGDRYMAFAQVVVPLANSSMFQNTTFKYKVNYTTLT